MNDQPHTTLVYLKTRRDEAREEEARLLMEGRPDAMSAVVADAYEIATALFEELDRRLRELVDKWREEESVTLPALVLTDSCVADIEAILQEFEG